MRGAAVERPCAERSILCGERGAVGSHRMAGTAPFFEEDSPMGQRRSMLAQSALIASVLFLAGCKTELTTAVNYTDLLGAPTYQKGSLVIEIPGCKDPGTEFESDALLQVKSRVPAVFPKAQYLGCREESITAEALFSLPILVGARAGCGGPSSASTSPTIPSARSRLSSRACASTGSPITTEI